MCKSNTKFIKNCASTNQNQQILYKNSVVFILSVFIIKMTSCGLDFIAIHVK